MWLCVAVCTFPTRLSMRDRFRYLSLPLSQRFGQALQQKSLLLAVSETQPDGIPGHGGVHEGKNNLSSNVILPRLDAHVQPKPVDILSKTTWGRACARAHSLANTHKPTHTHYMQPRLIVTFHWPHSLSLSSSSLRYGL